MKNQIERLYGIFAEDLVLTKAGAERLLDKIDEIIDRINSFDIQPAEPEKLKYGCNGENPCRHGVNLPIHPTPEPANQEWEEEYDKFVDSLPLYSWVENFQDNYPKLKSFIHSLLATQQKLLVEEIKEWVENFYGTEHQITKDLLTFLQRYERNKNHRGISK